MSIKTGPYSFLFASLGTEKSAEKKLPTTTTDKTLAPVALFDPLKTVKKEADSTLASEKNQDPFSEIGELCHF